MDIEFELTLAYNDEHRIRRTIVSVQTSRENSDYVRKTIQEARKALDKLEALLT